MHGNGRTDAIESTGMPDLEETIERAREQIEMQVERAAEFVRERPVVAVLGAVAIGYLVGRLVARR